MSYPLITIAICTWNRASSLRQTLISLEQMEAPSDFTWELLIIDNNCTDNTKDVVGEFSDSLPIFLCYEPRQGQAHARNRAIEAAKGEYIIWTDDDVIVSKKWLSAYTSAFRARTEAALFGGPIHPRFEGNPPQWLKLAMSETNVRNAFALRDLGLEEIRLDLAEKKIPYGANFAIRMKEQRCLSYDTKLGLERNGNVRGEETDLITRLLEAGAHGYWVPEAAVEHVIPRSRQKESYLRDYFIGQGRAEVRKNPTFKSKSLMGVPFWLWTALLRSHLRYSVARLFRPPRVWCWELSRAYNYLGRFLEYHKANRST